MSLEDVGSAGVKLSVGVDANAAIGIVQRRGSNKLRHVELDVLWIQEQQARRLFPLRKGAWSQNSVGHDDQELSRYTQLEVCHGPRRHCAEASLDEGEN